MTISDGMCLFAECIMYVLSMAMLKVDSLLMIYIHALFEHHPNCSTMILLALVVSLSLIKAEAYFGGFRDHYRPNAPALNLKEDYNSTIFNGKIITTS